MLVVVAKCMLVEGKKEEFKEKCSELIKETNKESGSISYDLYEDINDNNIVTFIEEWESKEALDNHMKTKHFTSIVPKLRELQREDSIVNIYSK